MIMVITGDLVRSTQLDTVDYQRTIRALQHYLDALSKQYETVHSLYRGDGFQLAGYATDQLPVILLKIKLWLASGEDTPAIHCTLSGACGEGALSGRDPGMNSGPALITSGRTLETLRSAQLMLHIQNCPQQEAVALLCNQLSYILNRLSARQSALLYEYLNAGFPTHQALAQTHDTTRQNISERLKAAGADLLPEFIGFAQQCCRQSCGAPQ